MTADLPTAGAVAAGMEAAFLRIERERMRGVPILNAALRVEAVGLRRWEGHWLGALITPWFIDLMLLPDASPPARAWAGGEMTTWRFPSGSYDFRCGHEQGLGLYQSCSLFSPVLEFVDQAAARAAAMAALQGLFLDAASVDAVPDEGDAPVTHRKAGTPLSRRGFLGAALLRER